MILLQKTLMNTVVALAVYILVGAFMSDHGLSAASIKARIWPNGLMFGVFYGVISYLISRYRQNKS